MCSFPLIEVGEGCGCADHARTVALCGSGGRTVDGGEGVAGAAGVDGAGHARYTFQLRVPSTVHALLMAEWGRRRCVWNKNRLESLADGVSPFGGFGYRNEPGQPLFAAYWPTMTGYSDANGNGVIEPSEVQVSSTSVFGGSTVPTRTISLNNTIGLFKDRLRLSALADYRGGYTTHEISTGFACGLGPNNCREIHDPKAPLLDQARAMAVGRALGAYWEKGDFIRVREIAAVYDLPLAVTRMVRSPHASIVLSARNMGIWTKEFTGWDPEILTQGQDANPYNFVQQGQPRTFIIRFNLGY